MLFKQYDCHRLADHACTHSSVMIMMKELQAFQPRQRRQWSKVGKLIAFKKQRFDVDIALQAWHWGESTRVAVYDFIQLGGDKKTMFPAFRANYIFGELHFNTCLNNTHVWLIMLSWTMWSRDKMCGQTFQDLKLERPGMLFFCPVKADSLDLDTNIACKSLSQGVTATTILRIISHSDKRWKPWQVRRRGFLRERCSWLAQTTLSFLLTRRQLKSAQLCEACWIHKVWLFYYVLCSGRQAGLLIFAWTVTQTTLWSTHFELGLQPLQENFKKPSREP